MRTLVRPRPPSPPVGAARLELRDVSVRYRRRGPWVLQGLSLTVAAGEVVEVAAANGGGKTTMLRVSAGLQSPTAGRVRAVGDRRYVPEQAPAPPALTVRHYLGHQARLQGVPRSAVRAWVDATIDHHRLGPAADQPLRRLSKGWSQRCLLAPALAGPGPGRPPGAALVLLDEPWTGVDTRSRDHLVGVVYDLAGAGSAVVLASHEPTALPTMRRLELRDGRLEAEVGTAELPVSASIRRVALVGLAGAPPLDAALTSAAGVLALRGDGDRRELVVSADADGDRVLAALLQRGWTIERLVTGDLSS